MAINVLIEMNHLSLNHPGPNATHEENAAFYEAKAVMLDHVGLPLLAKLARKHAAEELTEAAKAGSSAEVVKVVAA
jgi:hypothetical protein